MSPRAKKKKKRKKESFRLPFDARLAFPSNMSSCEAKGATSLAFNTTTSFVELMKIVMKKPPPRPVLWGIATPSQNNAAIAASTADPPFCMMELEKIMRICYVTKKIKKIENISPLRSYFWKRSASSDPWKQTKNDEAKGDLLFPWIGAWNWMTWFSCEIKIH